MQTKMFRPNTQKFIAILFSIFCTAWSQENRIILNISTAQVLELRKCADTCGKQHGVDPNDLRKIISWNMPDDEPHKKFLFCIFFTCEYIAEDGHFIIDRVVTLKPINGTLEETRQIYEDCNKITKGNNIETVTEMDGCFHRHFIPSVETVAKG